MAVELSHLSDFQFDSDSFFHDLPPLKFPPWNNLGTDLATPSLSDSSPNFTTSLNMVTDGFLEQGIDSPSSSSSIDLNPLPSRPQMNTSPFNYPSPTAGSVSPYSGLPSGNREPSRWTPCAPLSGPPRSLPPTGPSRWTPCAPPSSYPTPLLREPSKWAPCSPPSATPSPRTQLSPVARTPFHNPCMNARLGLSKCCLSPKSYVKPLPRSAPAQCFSSPSSPLKTPSFAIDPSLLNSRALCKPQSSPSSFACTTSSRMAESNPYEQIAPSIATCVQPPPIVAPAKPRRGSIHLEDLCRSDEESNAGFSSPKISVPISPSPAKRELENTKSHTAKASAQTPLKRKLPLDFYEPNYEVSSNDADDEGDKYVPKKKCRTSRKKKVVRRSGRQRNNVVYYAE